MKDKNYLVLIIVIVVLAIASRKQVMSSEPSNHWNSVQEKAETKIESKNGWVRLWYQIKDFLGESHFIYNPPSKLADNGLLIRARGEGAWMISLGTTDVIPDLSMLPYFMIEAKKEAADLYLPFSDFGFRGDHIGDVSMPKPHEVKSLIFTPSLGWSEPGQSHFLEIKEIRTYKKGTPDEKDKDGDGIPDHDDYDIDGDGWFNVLEGYAGTDQMDPSDFPNAKLIAPSSGCYTGLFVTSGATGILEFETLTGMKPAIINLFPGWEIDQRARLKMDRPFLEWIWRHGSIPRHSWLPEGNVRLQDIIDGKHDQMIAELAEEVKALKQPIIWPWGVEVDGSPLEPSNGLSNFGKDGTENWYDVDNLNSYYGQPDEPDGIERWKDYVSRVRKIFDYHSVDNLVYFFHALGTEYTESGGDITDGQLPVPGNWNTVTNYYPGTELVDWVGFSLNGPGWNGFKWMTIEDILDESYLKKLHIVSEGKPIMVPEFSFFPQTNWQNPPPQSRAELFSRVFSEIKTKYPSIKAWTFGNTRALSPPVTSMWIVAPYMGPDSPPDEIEAFRKAVTDDPYFIKDPILFPKSKKPIPEITGADVRDLPLLAPGNHLTIQRAEEFKFSAAVEAQLNAKWDTAVARGMDIAMVGVDWAALEPQPGIYDKAMLEEPLKACQVKGLQPVLLLTTLDSEGYYAMPAEFVDQSNDDKLANGMHIDDPRIVARFKALLDWVVPMVLEYNGFLLSIANEPESLFGGKPEEQQQFVNFLIAAREHTRTITKDLPVTVTLTRAVLTGDLDNVIAECDVAYFNYYGQADPFTAPEPPSMVSQRIDELLAVAKGRQLLLQEVGLPSGYEDKPSGINSSPQMQAEFLENVFRKLKAEPRFRGACVFLMPDMSEEFCDALEQLYLNEGLPKSLTARIRESFQTTGLCRTTDGSAKPAWNTFLEGLDMIYENKDKADPGP